MDEKLKERVERYEQAERELRKERKLLTQALKDKVVACGWSVETDYWSMESLLENTSPPDKDTLPELNNTNPILEVREISKEIYKRPSMDHLPRTGRLFAILQSPSDLGYMTRKMMIEKTEFKGMFVCFHPRSNKVSYGGEYGLLSSLKFTSEGKQRLLEKIERLIERDRPKILANPSMYLTSNDKYERYIAAKYLKEEESK